MPNGRVLWHISVALNKGLIEFECHNFREWYELFLTTCLYRRCIFMCHFGARLLTDDFLHVAGCPQIGKASTFCHLQGLLSICGSIFSPNSHQLWQSGSPERLIIKLFSKKITALPVAQTLTMNDAGIETERRSILNSDGVFCKVWNPFCRCCLPTSGHLSSRWKRHAPGPRSDRVLPKPPWHNAWTH